MTDTCPKIYNLIDTLDSPDSIGCLCPDRTPLFELRFKFVDFRKRTFMMGLFKNGLFHSYQAPDKWVSLAHTFPIVVIENDGSHSPGHVILSPEMLLTVSQIIERMGISEEEE